MVIDRQFELRVFADVFAQGAAQDLAQSLVANGSDALGLLLKRRFDADHDERFYHHTRIISCITRYVYSPGADTGFAWKTRPGAALWRASVMLDRFKPISRLGACEKCGQAQWMA